jgi:isorenieratene synthase
MLRRDSWKMQHLPGNSHDYLIQPLIDAIEARGGRLIRGATAQHLEEFHGGWRVVVEDERVRGKRTVMARHVILAVNASAAKRLLLAGEQTYGEASGMRFPGTLRTVAVRLWFDAQPREGASAGMFTGDFKVDNFFWLHRLYAEFAEWALEGGSAIEVHIYGTEKQLDQPEKNLLITAISEVQTAFPELKGHFVHGAVRRNSRTHTQFRVPTQDSLFVETPWRGVYACGDWVGHPTPAMWMERATITGIAAANTVLDAHHFDRFEITKPRRPELLALLIGGVVRLFRVVLHPLYLGLRWLRRSRK